MTELQWTPAELGALTLPQLVCLVSKSPPGADAGRCTTTAEALALADRLRREEDCWHGL